MNIKIIIAIFLAWSVILMFFSVYDLIYPYTKIKEIKLIIEYVPNPAIKHPNPDRREYTERLSLRANPY